ILWACDPTIGAVATYLPDQQKLSVFRAGFNLPRAVAVDTTDHDAWVADQGFNLVQHVTPFGTPASSGISATGPIGVAVDPETHAVWICERAGNRVSYVLPDGSGWTAGMVAPSQVAVDSTTHFGWVTSFATARVVVMSPAGAPLDTLAGFGG